MLESALQWTLIAGACAFVLAGATAPLAALGWWAGQDDEAREPSQTPTEEPNAEAKPSARRFLVYLGGIDTFDGASLSPREQRFLHALKADLPEMKIVDTLFPYAVTGEPLIQEPRVLRWLWRELSKRTKDGGARRTVLANLINARNLFQVMVSADRRYGPIYNAAIAKLVLDALADAGWRPASGATVTLLGYSGGAQMAAGAGEALAARIHGPLELISLGGVLASSQGLMAFKRIVHITARRDRADRLAVVGCPGRWPIAVGSAWNRANVLGKVRRVRLGDMRHSGERGYLGERRDNAGRENWEVTLAAVREAIAA